MFTDGCLAPESSNGTGTYEHTSTTTFACDTGYQLSTGDVTIEAICDDGSWSPDVECTSSGKNNSLPVIAQYLKQKKNTTIR